MKLFENIIYPLSDTLDPTAMKIKNHRHFPEQENSQQNEKYIFSQTHTTLLEHLKCHCESVYNFCKLQLLSNNMAYFISNLQNSVS